MYFSTLKQLEYVEYNEDTPPPPSKTQTEQNTHTQNDTHINLFGWWIHPCCHIQHVHTLRMLFQIKNVSHNFVFIYKN